MSRCILFLCVACLAASDAFQLRAPLQSSALHRPAAVTMFGGSRSSAAKPKLAGTKAVAKKAVKKAAPTKVVVKKAAKKAAPAKKAINKAAPAKPASSPFAGLFAPKAAVAPAKKAAAKPTKNAAIKKAAPDAAAKARAAAAAAKAKAAEEKKTKDRIAKEEAEKNKRIVAFEKERQQK